MKLDLTINLGQIITAVSFVTAALYAWAGMKYQVASIVDIISRHEVQLKAHAEKIDDHDRQINRWIGAKVGEHE